MEWHKDKERDTFSAAFLYLVKKKRGKRENGREEKKGKEIGREGERRKENKWSKEGNSKRRIERERKRIIR